MTGTKYCEISYEDRDCILVALRKLRDSEPKLSDDDYKYVAHLIVKLSHRFSDAKSLP